MFDVTHSIENGIERIVYRPRERRFATPLVLQHGMWHGAWCWQDWQAQLAEWGWESHAHSLPGHAGSPVQRPIRWCTLGYYLAFLQAEMAQLGCRPVLMGHSMGGALAQWYLKQVGDLPAAVLVAPWLSHSMMGPILATIPRDPAGFVRSLLNLTTTPLVRNPKRAAQMFISDGARLSPQALYEKLGPESLWVLLQYNPPFWRPATAVDTPLLWLAGGGDTLISEAAQRRSAAHYGAAYHVVPEAGHNIMLERSAPATIRRVHEWLVAQGID
ncbi:MAG: alpha/beta fold hydrolase [Ardenticatenaceae bacterium]|nr:alpha/beta fold hydrolase [Anaerolineales bacterium]MCB8917273.1 alpha/beta fold hydrolase [Ardenticatenaceae bacterium]